MARRSFPLFQTFLCCSLGQTVIKEIDIEIAASLPFPFFLPLNWFSHLWSARERFNEEAVYSPLLNLSAAEGR